MSVQCCLSVESVVGLSYSERDAKEGVEQEFGRVGRELSSLEKYTIDTHWKDCHTCMCEEFTMMMNFKSKARYTFLMDLIVNFPFFPLSLFYISRLCVACVVYHPK